MPIIPGQGTSSYTSVSALDKILMELKKIKDLIVTTGGGSATEATLQLVENNTDGLEGLATTANGLLTSIDGNLAGLATEATLQAIDANTDSIEPLLVNVDATLSSINTTIVSCDTDAILTAFNQLSKDTGTFNGDTLRVVLTDGNRTAIDQLEVLQTYANWDMIPGRSKVITWVAGTIQPFVVDTIGYYIGAGLVITQTFTYDANDNVTSIVAS